MTTDTKAVARWDWDMARLRMDTFVDGRYVRFTDHERVVGELKEAFELAMTTLVSRNKEVNQLDADLAASRAEVEGLRAALQQIEGMTPVHGLNPRAKISDPQHVKVCWNTQLAARSALAAMEKGNV